MGQCTDISRERMRIEVRISYLIAGLIWRHLKGGRVIECQHVTTIYSEVGTLSIRKRSQRHSGGNVDKLIAITKIKIGSDLA
jgi:hypothetical protein